jgi:hypothetical protein
MGRLRMGAGGGSGVGGGFREKVQRRFKGHKKTLHSAGPTAYTPALGIGITWEVPLIESAVMFCLYNYGKINCLYCGLVPADPPAYLTSLYWR